MADEVEFQSPHTLHNRDARFLGADEHRDIGAGVNFAVCHAGMPAVGDAERLVDVAEQGTIREEYLLGKDAGELVRILLETADMVEIAKCCLRSPADVKRGDAACPEPVHQTAELRPIVHIGEIHPVEGGTCDDSSVERLRTVVVCLADGSRTRVESHVLGTSMARHMAVHLGEDKADGFGRLRTDVSEVGFRLLLVRHQVQQRNVKHQSSTVNRHYQILARFSGAM